MVYVFNYLDPMKVIVFLLLISTLFSAIGQIPEIGIVNDMEQDSMLYAAGYRSLSESISKCFSPKNLTDTQFTEKLKAIQKLRTRMVACNLFIPGEMKLVGPDLDEGSILVYTEQVFQRCQKAKVGLIVWGSGGARRIPGGFSKEKAKDQFINIAGKVAVQAKKYDVVLALESLNRSETNFINTLAEALEIVKKVNHPNLKLNADFYHLRKENEQPSVIEEAGGYIVHCELAERDKRTPPGTMGDDFRAYLRALKNIHYKGRIMLECRWDNFAYQAISARSSLQQQLEDVFR